MSKGEKREESPPVDSMPMAKRHTRNHNRSELLGHDLEGETMNPFSEDLSPQEWHTWNQNRLKEWETEAKHERMAAAARAKRGELTAEDQRAGLEWAKTHDYMADQFEPRQAPKPRGWFARFIEWVGR